MKKWYDLFLVLSLIGLIALLLALASLFFPNIPNGMQLAIFGFLFFLVFGACYAAAKKLDKKP